MDNNIGSFQSLDTLRMAIKRQSHSSYLVQSIETLKLYQQLQKLAENTDPDDQQDFLDSLEAKVIMAQWVDIALRIFDKLPILRFSNTDTQKPDQPWHGDNETTLLLSSTPTTEFLASTLMLRKEWLHNRRHPQIILNQSPVSVAPGTLLGFNQITVHKLFGKIEHQVVHKAPPARGHARLALVAKQ